MAGAGVVADNMKFRYTIYLGYDVGDRLLDSDAGRAKLNVLPVKCSDHLRSL